MNILRLFTLPLILILITNVYAQQSPRDSAKGTTLGKKLSGLFQNLGPGINDVDMDWKNNPEVAQILSYPGKKRIAAIHNIIFALEENDGKIFKNIDKNSYQLTAMIIVRIVAYTHLKGLIQSSNEDIGIRDYLDSEIADLTLAINQKIPYGLYLQARRQRGEKLAYIYWSNKDYVAEMIKQKNEKNIAIIKLSNKTSSISLIETCTQNVELCEKL